MMEVNKRPIIFPYSNPTSHSECTAAEAYAATNGECLFASGSPMPPLEHNGETIYPAQGNNVYIFPAMGLAIYATQATHVSDQMFLRAGQALAETLNEDEMKSGLLYPKRHRLRECSLHVATKIAEQIFTDGHTDKEPPDDIAAFVEGFMWTPAYGDEI
jgi:malate dehydrogenase (oxaloacetate-decarboxylating)(NADP+)